VKDGRFAGKVAIVTGAASGIGRASALALAREGASVLVADLHADGAERVAAEIAAQGGRAAAQRADVGDEASVAAMVAAAVARFGHLDVLHNNAAASDAATIGAGGEITALDVAIWDRALAVNLRGPMLGCKHAIPRMLARGGGSIVNTSSVSGLAADATRPAYGVSKAGLDALTRYVATQYGKRGIRCNSIAPGVIDTPSLAANVPREPIAIYQRSTLLARLGRAEDVANAVVFLASEESAFVTGQTLVVDGGFLTHQPTYSELRQLAGEP